MHGGWFEMPFRQLHSVISIVSPVNCSLSQNYEMSEKHFPNPSEKKQGDYNITTSVSKPRLLLIVKYMILHFAIALRMYKIQVQNFESVRLKKCID